MISHALDGQFEEAANLLVWMPSHIAVASIGASKDSKGCPITPLLRLVACEPARGCAGQDGSIGQQNTELGLEARCFRRAAGKAQGREARRCDIFSFVFVHITARRLDEIP